MELVGGAPTSDFNVRPQETYDAPTERRDERLHVQFVRAGQK